MQEFIDKLIGRLEEEKQRLRKLKNDTIALSDSEVIAIEEGAYNFCKEIINELAEEHKKTVDETNYADIELYAFWEKWHDKVENNGWIPCSERLPEEHDSIFAKVKGTDKWNDAMFEKISDDVNVTIEFEDGTRTTKTLHTVDGRWHIGQSITKFNVIAWQPLPPTYKEN